MDNRVFNVNGKGQGLLEATLTLAFAQHSSQIKAKGYLFDPEFGLVLLWYWPDKLSENHPPVQKFMAPLPAEKVAPMIMEWLKSEEAGKVKLEGWDRNADHDGHNSQGWRVYCGDWGHVGRYRGAIVAVTPAYMWHGK